MATLLMRTADVRDLSTVTVGGAGGYVAISSTEARTGTYSYKLTALTISANSGQFYSAYSSGQTRYIGFGVFLESIPTTTLSYVAIRESAIEHIKLVLDGTAGEIKVYRGATLIGTTSGANLIVGEWRFVEVKATIDNSAGEVVVKVNGTQVLSLTSTDTQNGGTATSDNVFFQSGVSSSNAVLYIDDVKVDDADYPGQGGLYVLAVSADGTNTAWTASAGSDYQCVDDNPPNDDTDYIKTDASVSGTRDSFTIGSLPITAASIPRVAVFAKGKLDAAGSGTLDPSLYINASNYDATGTGLDTGYQWAIGYWDVNPDDAAAWEQADVDAMEAGVATG